jgi:hypothetical protein
MLASRKASNSPQRRVAGVKGSYNLMVERQSSTRPLQLSRDNTRPGSDEEGNDLSFNLLLILAESSPIWPTTLVVIARDVQIVHPICLKLWIFAVPTPGNCRAVVVFSMHRAGTRCGRLL